MADRKGATVYPGRSDSSGRDESAGGPARAAYLLSQLGAHASGMFAQRLSPTGLTPAHAGVLRLLAREPELNQRALAARLQAVPSRVVALIDELEELGLLTRERRPQDRRSHILRLTRKGDEMLTALRHLAESHEAELLAVLSQSDRVLLASLLHRLAAAHSLDERVHPGYQTEAT